MLRKKKPTTVFDMPKKTSTPGILAAILTDHKNGGNQGDRGDNRHDLSKTKKGSWDLGLLTLGSQPRREHPS